MDISKEDFIKLTTEGYPIELHHQIDDFYDMIASFVNQSKENEFFAQVKEGVVLHAGMRTEVCKVIYEKDRVFILSKISDDEHSSTGEFNFEEEFQILGHACLGVIYFCDLYSLATGQSLKTKPDTFEGQKSALSSNTKYDIWPM
tara:strand:+ start:226 stop:660 length:435 start_codon:yes stop_codon:yes gene_type:complete